MLGTRRRSRRSIRRLAGWTFLAVSINGAAYTVTAFRPARGRYTVGWSFFASWITIELAPFHLIWQVVATALFATRGALSTRPGRIGLGLTLASWAGLLMSIRESYAARAAIRDALREEHTSLNPTDASGPARPVRVRRNLVFARVGGKTLRMDIHEPESEPGATNRPALVQIHGGGWVIGFKKHQGQVLMRRLASHGWVCCNIDYRLSPMATFPDHLADVKRAIAWIREHAEELGIDPGFVAVTGGSAGGHLAALTALTENRAEFQPGFEDADTSVQVAVPFYGVYDFTNRNGTMPERTIPDFLAPLVMKADPDEDPERYAAASPLDQVHADAPPFLVIHGTIDVLAPVGDARDFVGRLRAVSRRPVHYLELKGAQHAFDTFPSIRASAVVEAAARFLESTFATYREANQAL